MAGSRQDVPFAAAIRTLAKGAGITLLGSVLGRGLLALSQITIARMIGPALFGLYSIGWIVLTIAGTLAQVGLDIGVVRYASIHRGRPEWLKGTLLLSVGFSFGFGLVLGGVLFLLAPLLAKTVFHAASLTGVFRLFAVGVPFMSAMVVAAAGTRASQRVHYAIITTEVVRPGVNLILVVIFYLLGWRLVGAVAAAISATGVAFLASLGSLARVFPEIVPGRVRPSFATVQVLSFSLPLLAADVFGTMVLWTDALVLGHYRSATTVGIYRAAVQVALLLTAILTAFNAIFAPMMAEVHQGSHRAQGQELFKVSAKWGLYASLPLYVLILTSSREILRLSFGEAYSLGAVALVLLATAQTVNIATGQVGNVIVMSGHQKMWLANQVVLAVLNVGLNLVLVPRWGMVGAAVATGTTITLFFLVGLAEAWVVLKMSPYDRRHAKVWGAAGMALVAGLALRHVLSPPAGLAPYLVGQVTVIFAVYVAALLLLGLDPEDRAVWKAIAVRFAPNSRT